MKKLYLRKTKYDISNLKALQLDENSIVDMENTEEKRVLIVEKYGDELSYNGEQEENEVAYRIFDELPKEKDDEGHEKLVTVGGYIEYTKKEDKKSKIKKDNKKLMASLFGYTPVLREVPKFNKVVGYLKIDGDTYLGIVKPVVIIPILLLGLSATIIVVSTTIDKPNKSPIDLDKFVQGEVEQGDIIIEDKELEDTQYLRVIMNVSPTLENGNMNLFISNNKDSNILSMVGEVYLLSKVDNKGGIIEEYDKPIKIAETPLLHPGDKMDNVPVDADVTIESGLYDGRVMYTAYKITDDGALPIGQVAGRINLNVK